MSAWRQANTPGGSSPLPPGPESPPSSALMVSSHVGCPGLWRSLSSMAYSRIRWRTPAHLRCRIIKKERNYIPINKCTSCPSQIDSMSSHGHGVALGDKADGIQHGKEAKSGPFEALAPSWFFTNHSPVTSVLASRTTQLRPLSRPSSRSKMGSRLMSMMVQRSGLRVGQERTSAP
ncbi:unnamed protein product [Protopolystoma xenopodis]|uniref:Uncharacterized protein n=1 Tax=Protopolystoma xenopodis TaxID=117903 RepID=A0A448WZB4_9PLAT|nr:unnamed protein product [Protopolystoma xenopodis]